MTALVAGDLRVGSGTREPGKPFRKASKLPPAMCSDTM